MWQWKSNKCQFVYYEMWNTFTQQGKEFNKFQMKINNHLVYDQPIIHKLFPKPLDFYFLIETLLVLSNMILPLILKGTIIVSRTILLNSYFVSDIASLCSSLSYKSMKQCP